MTQALLQQFMQRGKRRHLLGIAAALSVATEARDPYTRGHSERVGLYAKHLALALGWTADAAAQLAVTGFLHDIGKIGVPERVLLKRGPLDLEEWKLVKRHPLIGYEIVKQIEDLSPHLDGVRHHHERLDGSGYPDGLVGEDIAMSARILAVADIWDALTSHRPYRAAMAPERAFEILQKEVASDRLDADLVNAFEGLVGRRALERLLRQAGNDTNIARSVKDRDPSIFATLHN